VCQEAGCPNIFECWEDREATFLIGGDQCTRRCDFCQIDTGKPRSWTATRPRRVAESVVKMGRATPTVTGVARDDLPDGVRPGLYAETIRQITS
jgi:lipoic acid synthetase